MTAPGAVRRIYPARRAVEHVTSLDGVRPTRLFPVLWPLWQVETSANFYEEQAYEVVDRFLIRTMAEAGLSRVDEIVAFLGIPAALASRCFAFLATIGHVVRSGDTVALTDLGRRSAGADIRYVAKESRQDLLIEKFTGKPLPRRLYQGSVPIFPAPQVPAEAQSDRSTFAGLFAPAQFQRAMVEQLATRSDRAELNLPRQLHGLTVLGERDAYLPAYVIETVDSGLLVYTAAVAERDPFFEDACRAAPAIAHMMRAEAAADPRGLWTEWLVGNAIGRGTLTLLPNGIWRATFSGDVFGPAPLTPLHQVGSYVLRKRHFLQVWCADGDVRRRAAMDRLLAMTQLSDIATRDDLRSRAETVARALDVATPGFADLQRYAAGDRTSAGAARTARLERLP